VGCSETDLALWGSDEVRGQLQRQVRQAGHIHSAEVQLRSKDGPTGNYLLSAETVTINQERCLLTVMLDFTERKQTEMQLLTAIESVMQDTSWFGQKIVEKLASLRPGEIAAPGPEIGALTGRAREILSLLAQGLSDDDIARKLGVARQTVRNHISAIYHKLGVHRRSAVIVWARERGLGTEPKPLTTFSKPRRGRHRK
jgi:DNA-binding NarL/FixJ family response regulator